MNQSAVLNIKEKKAMELSVLSLSKDISEIKNVLDLITPHIYLLIARSRYDIIRFSNFLSFSEIKYEKKFCHLQKSPS